MDSDTEFLTLANAKLEAIDEWLNAATDELSTSRNGNVLTIELDDGQQVVVNIQTPMHEIWLASRFGGLHFQPQGDAWVSTRDATTLDETLAHVLTQLGIEIDELA